MNTSKIRDKILKCQDNFLIYGVDVSMIKASLS